MEHIVSLNGTLLMFHQKLLTDVLDFIKPKQLIHNTNSTIYTVAILRSSFHFGSFDECSMKRQLCTFVVS